MVQVENEIGLLGSDRDYGEEAEEKFRAAVPAGVAEACGVSGTWAEAFGEEAGENFMAYCFACAVQKIAAAGQKEYALPLYTNVWLRQYPWYPGSYPSGGPVPGRVGRSGKTRRRRCTRSRPIFTCHTARM
jgi:hypothetical protein